MTNFFVDNAGSNTAPYDTWAKAATKLATTLTSGAASGVAQAGDTIYVANTHSETTAADINHTSNGTAASPIRVWCVTPSGAAGNSGVATGAVVVTTGANNGLYFASGVAYLYGIKFTGGSDAPTSASANFGVLTNPNAVGYFLFDSCELGTSANAAAVVSFGSTGSVVQAQKVELINTPIRFGHTGSYISVANGFIWRDTASAILGTVPTGGLLRPSTGPVQLSISNVDLSALGANPIHYVGSNVGAGTVLRDCRLGASAVLTTGTWQTPSQGTVKLHNCDSGATNYNILEESYNGTVQDETTIKRTGGASDGTTGFSYKMASSAGTKFQSPLVSPDIAVWNDATGSKTVTLEIVTDNVTLTDGECWIEVDYLGNASYPLGSKASDRMANVLSTPANQTTSSETWTTTGLTTPVKQALAVTFTANLKGWFRARVCLAKPSTTVYIDPKLTVT